MKSVLTAGVLFTAIAMANGASIAQDICSDGRTANGTCVNGPLANLMRQNAIIFSQPNISHTAFPVLPSGDWTYRYPNQLIPNLQPPSSTGQSLPPPPPP